MESYAEAQAFIDDLLIKGIPALPPLSNLPLDDLKWRAQNAFNLGNYQATRDHLVELLARDYEPALTTKNLAQVCLDLGRGAEAAEWYRQSLRVNPNDLAAHAGLIFILDSQPSTTDAETVRERSKFFEQFCRPYYEKRTTPRNIPDPDKPLRIGYLGGDWNFHSSFMAWGGVVSGHSAGYIPYAYSSLPAANEDTVTQQWRQYLGERYLEAYRLSPSQLAAVIKHDEIDILVDLSGFTDKHRLQTLACRPAPIQIQAWGYVLGTGSPMVDVIFGDRTVCPAHVRDMLVEQVYDLPCLLSYFPRVMFTDPTPLPCLTGHVTFGVFQRASKVNHETLRVWRRILEAVPDSCIVFKAGDYTSSRRELIVSALHGMEGRVTFAPPTNNESHLNHYQLIDLSLDPWPQTGGVSAMESLAMGVPLVTLLGPRMIQRLTASILTNVGFTECITESEDAYVAKAVELVTTGRERLALMRETAQHRLMNSPIVKGYPQAVETAYRTLWQEWCARQLSYGTIQ